MTFACIQLRWENFKQRKENPMRNRLEPQKRVTILAGDFSGAKDIQTQRQNKAASIELATYKSNNTMSTLASRAEKLCFQ